MSTSPIASTGTLRSVQCTRTRPRARATPPRPRQRASVPPSASANSRRLACSSLNARRLPSGTTYSRAATRRAERYTSARSGSCRTTSDSPSTLKSKAISSPHEQSDCPSFLVYTPAIVIPRAHPGTSHPPIFPSIFRRYTMLLIDTIYPHRLHVIRTDSHHLTQTHTHTTPPHNLTYHPGTPHTTDTHPFVHICLLHTLSR